MVVPVRELFSDIEVIEAWITAGQPPGRDLGHDDSMRVLKIIEEAGEAAAAYIGMTGQNPRKGVTHTETDLLAELADVAVTALCAMQHFTGSASRTELLIIRKVKHIMGRSNIDGSHS